MFLFGVWAWDGAAWKCEELEHCLRKLSRMKEELGYASYDLCYFVCSCLKWGVVTFAWLLVLVKYTTRGLFPFHHFSFCFALRKGCPDVAWSSGGPWLDLFPPALLPLRPRKAHTQAQRLTIPPRPCSVPTQARPATGTEGARGKTASEKNSPLHI